MNTLLSVVSCHGPGLAFAPAKEKGQYHLLGCTDLIEYVLEGNERDGGKRGMKGMEGGGE